MSTKNNGGPAWGGQNWRPGKESGTWFRHSQKYGPIVHYGAYLVILQGKRRLSREEWLALREQDKAETSRRVAAEAVARKAVEMTNERAEKQATLDCLIADTQKVANSPDWRISHVTSVSYKQADGIQRVLYENEERVYRGSHYHSIEWTLYYKGIEVWTWAGCWRPARISSDSLKSLGMPVEQVKNKCLEHHMASSHAADPVTAQVTPSLVEPKHWSEGTLCKYPLWVTLVGKSYDYHYQIENGGEPVFERLEGSDPQDSHVGWGWGDD